MEQLSVNIAILFLVKILAGTGVFLVGVHMLTDNMEQLATGRIKSLFYRTADRRLINMLIGAGITALIQSSGVTTVLIVGFVNVGILNLAQATAMIMGANIGTTVTAQIAALSAFPITTYLQLLVMLGMLLTMFSHSEKLNHLGQILAGLGLIFIGISLMSDSMRNNQETVALLFSREYPPLVFLAIGVLLTALVQSSSAVTSVVIAMAVAGIPVGSGGNEILYIILGTNIGSCVTALISSLGGSTNAKRAGLIHLLFNTGGTVLFFVFLLFQPHFLSRVFSPVFPEPATQVAMFHTLFNVVCTLLFLPLTGWFVRVAKFLIPEKESSPSSLPTFLDDRMLSSVSLAIAQLRKESALLSDTAMDAYRTAWHAFMTATPSLSRDIHCQIDRAGQIGQNMLSYLIRLSPRAGSIGEKEISDIHSNIGDMMRIAEIADNLTKYTDRQSELGLSFSEEARNELRHMNREIERLYALTRRLLLERDTHLLPLVDCSEERVDILRREAIDHHIQRLQNGECPLQASAIWVTLVSNMERLADHLTYVAHTVS